METQPEIVEINEIDELQDDDAPSTREEEEAAPSLSSGSVDSSQWILGESDDSGDSNDADEYEYDDGGGSIGINISRSLSDTAAENIDRLKPLHHERRRSHSTVELINMVGLRQRRKSTASFSLSSSTRTASTSAQAVQESPPKDAGNKKDTTSVAQRIIKRLFNYRLNYDPDDILPPETTNTKEGADRNRLVGHHLTEMNIDTRHTASEQSLVRMRSSSDPATPTTKSKRTVAHRRASLSSIERTSSSALAVALDASPMAMGLQRSRTLQELLANKTTRAALVEADTNTRMRTGSFYHQHVFSHINLDKIVPSVPDKGGDKHVAASLTDDHDNDTRNVATSAKNPPNITSTMNASVSKPDTAQPKIHLSNHMRENATLCFHHHHLSGAFDAATSTPNRSRTVSSTAQRRQSVRILVPQIQETVKSELLPGKELREIFFDLGLFPSEQECETALKDAHAHIDSSDKTKMMSCEVFLYCVKKITMKTLTIEQINRLRSVYSKYATDKSKGLTLDDMYNLQVAVGHSCTTLELERLVTEWDQTGNGCIQFDEFVSLMSACMKKEELEEQMEKDFCAFLLDTEPEENENSSPGDINMVNSSSNRGDSNKYDSVDLMHASVGPVQLHRAFHKMGVHYGMEEIEEMIWYTNENKRPWVTYLDVLDSIQTVYDTEIEGASVAINPNHHDDMKARTLSTVTPVESNVTMMDAATGRKVAKAGNNYNNAAERNRTSNNNTNNQFVPMTKRDFHKIRIERQKTPMTLQRKSATSAHPLLNE